METRNSTEYTGKMPVLFVGHGSPMNMVLSNRFTQHLSALGASLPRPNAIMVISAHWMTHGSYVSCVEKPRMIYDFYGFPSELYQVVYACDGAPSSAHLVTKVGFDEHTIKCDNTWGLDHGAYSILRHMFPSADIPIFEMSLDYSFHHWDSKPIQYHYELGKRLRSLRDNGVLIIGSGNIVHNLGRINFSDMDAIPFEWAMKADEKIRSHIMNGEIRDLIQYPITGEFGSLAAPTLDHYLPMIYALALQEEGEKIQFTYEGFQNGSISMRSFRIG